MDAPVELHVIYVVAQADVPQGRVGEVDGPEPQVAGRLHVDQFLHGDESQQAAPMVKPRGVPHVAALAGLAIVVFSGVHLVAAGAPPAGEGAAPAEPLLRIDPNLPPKWTTLRFNLVLWGVTIGVVMDRDELRLNVGQERRIEIAAVVSGKFLRLKSGDSYQVSLRDRLPSPSA